MDCGSYKKFVSSLTEEDVLFDEPHVTERCQENRTSHREIAKMALCMSFPCHEIRRDRKNVFKIYFRASKRTMWKLVIELQHKRLMILTVKRLTKEFRKRIGKISRRRF